MRFVFILVILFLSLSLSRQAQAQSDAVFESKSATGSMTIEEYDSVPKGLLLPPELFKKANEASPPAPGQPAAGAVPVAAPVAAPPLDPTLPVFLSYEEILKLYRQGKFDELLKGLESLAKSGHPGAQELLGIMYRMGQGVPKNSVRAFELLSKAADAGRPLAQHHLGSMYFIGEGTKPDLAQALTWTGLATMYYPEGPEQEQSKLDRDNIFLQASQPDRDSAKMLQREWLKRRGDAHLLDIH